MAAVQIFPTGFSSNNWNLFGTSNPVSAMSDGADETYFDNYIPTTPHVVDMYSGASKPAALVGATINAVYVGLTFNAQPNKGTFHVRINGNNYILLDSYPITGGLYNVTAFKSWTHNDFYVPSTTWGLQSDGNADDTTKTVRLTGAYLYVDYTPATTPVAAFTVSTTTGTSPLEVTFTDQGAPAATSWLWSFGDGNTSSVQHPVYVYTTPATYTVTLTETNGGGTSAISTTSLITVLAAVSTPVAEFIANVTSGIQNLTVRFTDKSQGTPAITGWSWDFGDGETSTSQNPTHIYTTVGTYTVTLTSSNTVVETDSEVKPSYITVLPGGAVPLAQCSTTTGVRPLTVQFTGSATNALPNGWSWDFGDGLVSIAQNPIHVYNTVGTFTPELTVSNSIDSASDTTGPITVVYDTITADFTAAPIMGYIPFTVRFTDETLGDVSSWAWQFGDGETSSEQHPTHTYYTNQGVATLTVTQSGFSDDFDLRHGLIHYYKLEEASGSGDRIDFIGDSDLDMNFPMTQVTGKNDFGQVTDAGVTMVHLTYDDAENPWSVSQWIKLEDPTDLATLFIYGGDGSKYINIWLSVAAGPEPGLLALRGRNALQYDYGTTVLAADTWYHMVLTHDGAGVYKLYLDGELEATHTDSPVITGPGIGWGGPIGSDITYDEIGYYNIEIDQDQIQGLYNDGDGLFFNILATSDDVDLPDEVCPMVPDETWGYFLEGLKFQMMEQVWEQNPCNGFEAFGGLAKVIELTQQRLERFVGDTYCLRKEETLSYISDDTYALPTDLIDIIRVEINGLVVESADTYQLDVDSDIAGVYYVGDALTLILPGNGGLGTLKVMYTYVPDPPDIPLCECPTPPDELYPAFPLPYVLWWIIKYGVMADLFNQAGERNDPQRAQQCEELFNFGVQLYKLLYMGEV